MKSTRHTIWYQYWLSIRHWSWVWISCCFFCCSLSAQSNHYLKIVLTDTGAEEAKLPFQLEQTFADSLAQLDALKRILLLLQGEAYLAASIDSLIRKDSLTTAFLHLGQQYRWANLRNGNVETAFLSQVGFRERLYSNQLFQYQEVRQLQEALLNHAENNGYPFASVWLDSIEIKDNRVSAQIFMQRNRLFLIEAINIIGDAKISSAYLENYLGLQAGSLYSKEKILKIRNRIRELPFLQEKRDVTITFAGDRATVNLFLADKKASRFDFLIGLQPRTQVATGNQPEVRTFQLTGTFNADLHNQFGWGERIFAEFQQLRPETQELNLQFVYPYLLNLPFGTDLKFDLYKRDTSYLDVIIDVGVQYLFEGGNYLKAFWNNTSTAILNIDEATILAQKRLPQNLDVSRSTFGLEYQVQRLDYRFNPRKGWSALLRGGAGIKKIKRNSEILELAGGDFNPALIYDTLNLSTFQYQFTGNLAYYIPLFKRTTIKTSLQGGLIIAEEDIYQNEQFRIGGNRILRGFDEESIFASNYAVLTTELRFLIGLNSYFYAFGDFAYVENVTTERRNFDRPIGMGAGITFETKVGLFGFSLAVGRQQGNPFDFRSVKTHFGYVSLF